MKTCVFIWGEIEGVYIVEGKGILGLGDSLEVLGQVLNILGLVTLIHGSYQGI